MEPFENTLEMLPVINITRHEIIESSESEELAEPTPEGDTITVLMAHIEHLVHSRKDFTLTRSYCVVNEDNPKRKNYIQTLEVVDKQNQSKSIKSTVA